MDEFLPDYFIEHSSNLTLIDKFFIFHLSFDKNLDFEKKAKLQQIRHDLCSQYAHTFEMDFKNFTLDIIDSLYFDYSISAELKRVQPPTTLLKKISLLIKLAEILRVKLTQLNIFFESLKEQNIAIATNVNKPSDLSSFIDFINQKRNVLDLAYKNYESDYAQFKTLIFKTERYFQRSCLLIEDILFHFSDVDFNSAISKCADCVNLKNLLTKLKYCLSPAFNLELILIFIFTDLKRFTNHKFLTLVIEKYENFFLDIRRELHSVSAETKILLDDIFNLGISEITEPYISAPKFNFNDPLQLILKLKKIVSLYLFYIKTSRKIISPIIERTLKDFSLILKETRLTDTSYNSILVDLPSFVLRTFGLTNKNLAEIFAISESAVSRQRKNGQIIDNHLWFWRTATGFSLSYIAGNTTIPNYGKQDSDDEIRYSFAPASYMAFAELFLKYITRLKEYEALLKSNSKFKKKFILSLPYLSQISQKSILIAEEIHHYRIKLDKLYETYINSKQQYFANKSFVDDIDKYKKSADKDFKNFDSFFNKTIEILDKCLYFLKKYSP